MRYHALATDYDGTLAHHGVVDDETLESLRQWKLSGRKLLMVTGRELPDLKNVFPHLDLFDRVVAENGALLYNPKSRVERPLAEPPPRAFIDRLRELGVERISVGRVIVATWEPYESVVLSAIRQFGLELQVVFNKGAVMILPSGINKATGLEAALKELSLSAHNVVGVGDAENDHAFLESCECAVAVSNALPALKDTADWTTAGHSSRGVVELIQGVLESDLRWLEPRLRRHHISIGNDADDLPVELKPYGMNVLIAGSSGGGKSTLTTTIYEQLCRKNYQVCIIDPEGDYAGLEGPLLYGDARRAPTIDEAIKGLEHPGENVVVNLVGIKVEDRPAFFVSLISRIQELRAHTGRPHWIIIDEAHHVLPADLDSSPLVLPTSFENLVLVTLQPGKLVAAMLPKFHLVIGIGQEAQRVIHDVAHATGQAQPGDVEEALEHGEALAWVPGQERPKWFRAIPPHIKQRRHIRKYAEGELEPDLSFYFKGPEQKLNLRAHNLVIFLQISDGVDDATWSHHLRRGDYSTWFRDRIKDPELAREAERIERDRDLSAAESRHRIREAVEARYTAPAA